MDDIKCMKGTFSTHYQRKQCAISCLFVYFYKAKGLLLSKVINLFWPVYKWLQFFLLRALITPYFVISSSLYVVFVIFTLTPPKKMTSLMNIPLYLKEMWHLASMTSQLSSKCSLLLFQLSNSGEIVKLERKKLLFEDGAHWQCAWGLSLCN